MKQKKTSLLKWWDVFLRNYPLIPKVENSQGDYSVLVDEFLLEFYETFLLIKY